MSIEPLQGITSPMLAATASIHDVSYPCIVQDKEDGIRCFMMNDEGLSRKFKRIPNRFIQKILHDAMLPDGMDGELITLDENGLPDTFHTIQSKVMSAHGEPKFRYVVFDLANNQYGFYRRHQVLQDYLAKHSFRLWLQSVNWSQCNNQTQLENLEFDALEKGKEGLIIRSLNGRYKSGRSTINEGYLLKLKRFEDDEAVIMGYEELQHNGNEAGEDNFGYTERSSSAAGLVAGNTLGALIVKSSKFVEFFKIGTGFTQNQRNHFWDNKLKLLGSTVTYKYQKHGMKDKPRCPVFKGIRYD